ncbi:ATP-grasp domain-containing protein [Halorussus lipolyticus]|uniref:ATP-grasp domain-containing protein n=1 Tax=Halorussus lipolyticus TaxID=3034024 RepID=UPI0023E7B04B|nr:ATP-grasp domain-containing protein [Halorussus sp. DT80]
MATVLVTGVGGVGGTATVQSLQRHSDHEVVGVDMDPDADGRYLVDRWTTVPAAEDADWPDAMAEAVAGFDADAVIVLVDEELAELARLRQKLDGVPVVAPDQRTIDRSLDKYVLAEWLADQGLATPETELVSELDGLSSAPFPAVVKPRRGRGSRGVERVDSASELDDYLTASDRLTDELVVQHRLDGTEYTTSVVATRDDRLLSVVPKEAIEKDGCTVRGVSRFEPRVISSCRRVHDALSPGGPVNVQQILDAEGRPRTIEINPRFSSTACLTVAAGVNELDLLVRDALGESVATPGEFEDGVMLARYTDHVFVSEDDAEQSKSLRRQRR